MGDLYAGFILGIFLIGLWQLIKAVDDLIRMAWKKIRPEIEHFNHVRLDKEIALQELEKYTFVSGTTFHLYDSLKWPTTGWLVTMELPIKSVIDGTDTLLDVSLERKYVITYSDFRPSIYAVRRIPIAYVMLDRIRMVTSDNSFAARIARTEAGII